MLKIENNGLIITSSTMVQTEIDLNQLAPLGTFTEFERNCIVASVNETNETIDALKLEIEQLKSAIKSLNAMFREYVVISN